MKKVKKIIIILIVCVVVFGGGGFLVFGKKKPVVFETIEAQVQDVVHEVSVTGKVVPASDVDLAFEVSGKVALLPVKVGDTVSQGNVLVALETRELGAQLRQAQASAQSARAVLLQYEAGKNMQQVKLNEIIKGTRLEDLAISQTKVSNAEQSLRDAQAALASAQKKTEADLDEEYQNALAVLPKSVSIGLNALYTLTDVQFTYFLGNDSNSFSLAQGKVDAVNLFLGDPNGRQLAKEFMTPLVGGARGKVLKAQNTQSHADIDEAVSSMKAALFAIQSALNAVAVETRVSATAISNINTEKTNISTEIITVSGKQQAISVQKAANESAITTAQSSVSTSESALALAKNEFALKQAGATQEQIDAQRAQVSQSEAQMKSQQAMIVQSDATVSAFLSQIEKRSIRSPLNGIVTHVSVKQGEIVSSNSPVITVISRAKYEVEAQIPEVDIAVVSVGDRVRMTLDAYGSDSEFIGAVVTIDPAETVVDGVSTYTTTIQFESDDERIKSGMTANIDILTDKKEAVVALSHRALLQKDGKWFARILKGKDKNGNPLYDEREISIGLRGSDGNTEILQGITEGETVISFIEEK